MAPLGYILIFMGLVVSAATAYIFIDVAFFLQDRIEKESAERAKYQAEEKAAVEKIKPRLIQGALESVRKLDNGTYWFPERYFSEVSALFLRQNPGKKIVSFAEAPRPKGSEGISDPRPDGYWVVIE